MARPDSRGRVMRQSAVILAFGWLLAPLQFLTAVIVARAVGPEGKGALALLTGLTAILVSLVGLGIPSGAAYLYRQGTRSRAEVIGTALAVTAGASGLLFAAYAWGGRRLLLAVLSERDLANLDATWIALALVAVAPAALAAVADVVLIGANAMRVYAVRTAVSGLVAVALTWVLTMQFGWGVTGALASYPVAAVMGLAIFAWWWWRETELHPVRVTAACTWSLLRVGVQQHAIGIIALVAKRIDVFLIASLLSLADAGFYAAAILIPQAVVSIPRATMWPLVSSMAAEGRDVPDAVAQISRLQVLLMGLMALVLYPLAPLIVSVLFGAAFAPAVAPFRWALPGLLFTPVTVTVNAILTARGQPGLSIVSALIGTGVQVALTLLLIPTWGTSASAAALSANFITTALIQLAVIKSRDIHAGPMMIPLPEDFRALARAARAQLAAWRPGGGDTGVRP